MNTYKVEKEIYKHLRGLLTRSYHEFTFKKDDDGNWLCITPINEKNFELLLNRAACEKRSEEDGIYYITKKEHDNRILSMLLCRAAGVTCCAVIDDPMFEGSIH